MEVDRSEVVTVRVFNVAVNAPTSTPERAAAEVFAQPAQQQSGTPGPVQLRWGDDYAAFVTARLVGSGFDIKPEEQEKEYRFLDEGMVTWDWSVTPRQPGVRDLVVTVDVEYRRLDDPDAPPIVYQIGRQRLDVEIDLPVGRRERPIAAETIIVGVASALGGALLAWGFPIVMKRLTTPRRPGGGRRPRP